MFVVGIDFGVVAGFGGCFSEFSVLGLVCSFASRVVLGLVVGCGCFA